MGLKKKYCEGKKHKEHLPLQPPFLLPPDSIPRRNVPSRELCLNTRDRRGHPAVLQGQKDMSPIQLTRCWDRCPSVLPSSPWSILPAWLGFAMPLATMMRRRLPAALCPREEPEFGPDSKNKQNLHGPTWFAFVYLHRAFCS